MNDRLNVFYDKEILNHDSSLGFFETIKSPYLEISEKHPENSDRIRNMFSVLKLGPISEAIDWKEGLNIHNSDLELFHDKKYIEYLEKINYNQKTQLTSTTVLNVGNLSSIKKSAGLAVAAANSVWLNEANLAYSLCRPPGHHAQPSMADGYCFLNNIGIAIETLKNKGLKRAAVIDWDVHHGNGTQEGFYKDKDILTISIHMDHGPWGKNHKQTGKANELGSGHGYGKNLNIPLPFGAGNIFYSRCFEEIITPAIQEHSPEIIFVACGQDANQFDPNGRQLLNMEGFYSLGKQVRNLAEENSNGKLVLVQEGGYALSYSSYCLHSTLEGVLKRSPMLEDPIAYLPENLENIENKILEIKNIHNKKN